MTRRFLRVRYTDAVSRFLAEAPPAQRGRIEQGLRVAARESGGREGPGALHTPTHAVGYTIDVAAGTLTVYAVLSRREALRRLFGDEILGRISRRRWQKVMHGRRGPFEPRPRPR